MNLHAVLIVDGKEHKIDGDNIKFQLESVAPTTQGARGSMMGTQISESFSISGGTLVTSSTVRDQGGTTTTTTTTSGASGTTTTTTTTDGNGSTTDIKITRK